MTSSQKLVALAISEFMTPKGFRAFPSINLLAEWTSLSERTVRSSIQGVVKMGFLKVGNKAAVTGKGWRRHVYSAMWPDWLKSKATENEHQSDEKKDCQEAKKATGTGYKKFETSFLQKMFYLEEQELSDTETSPIRKQNILGGRPGLIAELESRGVYVD